MFCVGLKIYNYFMLYKTLEYGVYSISQLDYHNLQFCCNLFVCFFFFVYSLLFAVAALSYVTPEFFVKS